MDNQSVPFRLVGIQTIEFATIKEAYKEDDNINIHLSLGSTFGIKDKESKEVMCIVEFLLKQTEIPFLKIKVACFFEIEPSCWDEAYKEKTNSFVFPKSLADHLLVLTMGTLRGTLHAKTESTPFNKFIVPMMDISNQTPDNLEIELD